MSREDIRHVTNSLLTKNGGKRANHECAVLSKIFIKSFRANPNKSRAPFRGLKLRRHVHPHILTWHVFIIAAIHSGFLEETISEWTGKKKALSHFTRVKKMSVSPEHLKEKFRLRWTDVVFIPFLALFTNPGGGSRQLVAMVFCGRNTARQDELWPMFFFF